jgi:mannosyltransferase OCH1-like enzyme
MIPKVIYICHKTLDDTIKLYSQRWKILNPEYEVKLYDDELCKDFLLKEYSQLHLDIFNFLEDGQIKADFWRVCILNKYGGFYIDANVKPILVFNKFIENDTDFVACISFNYTTNLLVYNFNPHFILCNKNNIFLHNCIDTYIKQYNDKIPYNYLSWGICNLFIIDGLTKKNSHLIRINDKKFSFLYRNNEIIVNVLERFY